jgi:hypothetical protein
MSPIINETTNSIYDYKRNSTTFFGSSVGRDNSGETKRDPDMTQSNMTVSGIENKIYKDIEY